MTISYDFGHGTGEDRGAEGYLNEEKEIRAYAPIAIAALQRAGYKCQACSTKKEILDVHHNSYDRLGAEEPQDLIVLCRTCHGRVHNK